MNLLPIIIVLLLVMGLFGAGQGPQRDSAPGDGQVVVSTQFGGVLSPETVEVSETKEPEAEEFVANEEIIQPELPPSVETKASINIDYTSATLRGDVIFPGTPFSGDVYFLSSSNRNDVEAQSDSARRSVLYSRVQESTEYSTRLSGLRDDTRYYYRLCFENEDVTVCGDTVSFDTVEDIYRPYTEPYTSTGLAKDVRAEEMTLQGSYRLYDAENVTTFFVYGLDRNLVIRVPYDYEFYRDIDESGDDLQKVRVNRDGRSNGEVEKVIDDLENETTYYFSFCVDFDDDDGAGINCGGVQSRETKDRDRDIPTIGDQAVAVNGDQVRFSGRLDMEDYRNGHAFLVYGTDQAKIVSVEDINRFSSVYQSGSALQRVSIDTDLDGDDDVSETVSDLVSGDYWYRFCIEYVAEDDYYYGYEYFFLACGSVEEFSVN